MTTLLAAQQLSCARSQQCLFADVSFQLSAGELLLIEGANGSGKSSLLRLLAGLATPLSGNIYWQGVDVTTTRSEYQSTLHYIGHTNGIKQGLSVSENITLIQHLSLHTMPAGIYEQFHLVEHKHKLAYQLSAGQQRRLALTKLLIQPKKLWILDEPLTALDKNTQTLLLHLLQTHLANGGIAIVSTHQSLNLNNCSTKTLRLS